MKFTILVDSSLVIITVLCPGVEKILKEIERFYTIHPKIISPSDRESWNWQFLVSLTYRYHRTNFKLVKIGSVGLEKKMSLDDRCLTTDNVRCKTIAIGHLSDSGDLKISEKTRGPQIHWVLQKGLGVFINTSAKLEIKNKLKKTVRKILIFD